MGAVLIVVVIWPFKRSNTSSFNNYSIKSQQYDIDDVDDMYEHMFEMSLTYIHSFAQIFIP